MCPFQQPDQNYEETQSFPTCRLLPCLQDKVVASRLPNHWALKSIFITGIVYGLYLTLSSWVLYYVATHTSFFREHLKMHDLRYKPDSYLAEWCLSDNNPNRNVSAPNSKDCCEAWPGVCGDMVCECKRYVWLDPGIVPGPPRAPSACQPGLCSNMPASCWHQR